MLGGKAVAGIPDEDGFRALSTMGPGDFFGEIAALTGSPRTANVVADEETDLLEVPKASLQELLELPEMDTLINSKLNERLGRTARRPTSSASPGRTRARCATFDGDDRAGRRARRPDRAASARAVQTRFRRASPGASGTRRRRSG